MKLKKTMLKGSGARLTGQRALVFDIISGGGGHLGADEIYARARRRNARISLSTVYRAIARFKELGLVEESHLGQEHHHYEPRQNGSHLHLVCLDCRKVTEVAYPLVKKLKDDIGKPSGFRIVSAEVSLTGYCSKCGGR
jgi:Fe2+ or Zn2+ uptake regulation protein